MKLKILSLIVSLLFSPVSLLFSQQYRNPKYQTYVEQFSSIAVEKMYQHRIPASITLAQGILESGIGESRLARDANNHFGIKCHDWKGEYILHTDDKVNECFRKYKNPEESYEDHSLFLTTRGRYAHLFDLKTTDYKGWAIGLQRAGYATDPNYATRLITLIEENNLHAFDRMPKQQEKPVREVKTAPVEIIKPPVKESHKSNRYPARDTQRNMYGLRYVIANENDTYSIIANEFKVSMRSILKWNDLPHEVVLQKGDIVYLQNKKKRVTNYSTIHYVGSGETMHAISQRYGIQLKSLYNLNNMPYSQVPSIGQKLYLR
jgi:LysM repeat protein